MSKDLFWGALKIFALIAFVGLTNEDLLGRVHLLLAQGRVATMIMFLGVWGLCLTALMIAAFQPRTTWRFIWASMIAVTSFAGFTYMQISHSQLTVLDVASLWAAKADGGRALSFYFNSVLLSAIIAAIGFLAMMMRPPDMGQWAEKWLSRFKLAPVAPIAVILAIMVWKSGGGTHALPQQFAPAAMGLVVAVKNVTQTPHIRRLVAHKPVGKAAAKHIVLLVDESIRPDYISLIPGNRITPFLAARRNLIVNFGKASSAGNCSHYSNALMRLGAGANNVIKTVNTSPTMWQYARAAGFKTVFIDAAASHIKNAGALQNFMTAREKAGIDEFIQIEDMPSPYLDTRLGEVIARILARPEPHFIYANKNGAHFPYDGSYPQSERKFMPVMGKQGQAATQQAWVNSYTNAVVWSVDRFFQNFLGRADLSNTAIIYTSDHGQNLEVGHVGHCSTVNPHPREGLVPLMVFTTNKELRSRFLAGARLNHNRASHFAIFPTLLDLFGYPATILGKDYDTSLFDKVAMVPKFTSGDIFGLFRKQVHWTRVDLTREYREIKVPVATANARAIPSLRPSITK